MLHVKLDLVPFGKEDDRYQIEEIFIANSNRQVKEGYEFLYNVYTRSPKEQALPDFQVVHDRRDSAWVLLEKVLRRFPRQAPK